MKKIFFVSLILFAFIFKVEAKETYYSEYSDFSDYTLEKLESSELVRVEVERRYKFYKQEKVGEYRNFLSDNSSFKFFDLNDYKNSEFSDWSEEEPIQVENRVIESKSFYKIKRPKPIKSIYFVNTLEGIFKLNDVEVFYNGEKLDYELPLCNIGEDVGYSQAVQIELNDYYDLQKLTIKVGSIEYDTVDEILILASVPSENNLYQINYFSINLKSSNKDNVVIEASDWIRGNTKYEQEEIVEYKPVDEPLTMVTELKLYHYQDPLFYFYNVENKYIDGYFKDYPHLIKDENNYKDYYRYQVRDKLEVEEEIIITDHNQKLSDFATSTVEYEIITNLDINKNGSYEVEYKTPFITIKKEVIVDIKENELNDISNKYNNLLIDYNKLKQDYEYSVKDDENNDCELKLEEALLRVDDSNKKLKLSEQANKYLESNISQIDNKDSNKRSILWLILILIILFILLLIFLKKMSDKNKF